MQFFRAVVHPSLDLTNERPSDHFFSLNWIEFTIVKLFKGAGICSLNRGIMVNRDSLNQDLSVLFFEWRWRLCIFHIFRVLENPIKMIQTMMIGNLRGFCRLCKNFLLWWTKADLPVGFVCLVISDTIASWAKLNFAKNWSARRHL